MKTGAFLSFGLIAGLLACSCSTLGPAPSLSGCTMIAGIPFFRQEAYQCGPASLATVIGYWHGKGRTAVSVAPEQIAAEIYSPTARGVLGMDLESYARRRGFRTSQFAGTLSRLRELIDEGIPPVIFVDLGFGFYQVNHFMVVTGYTADGFVANTGRDENRFISEGDLNKGWKKTGYWTLIVEPPA